MARPTLYSPHIAETLCQHIAVGKSLREIAAFDDMPGVTTVRRWLRDNDEFRLQYARAREDQADTFAEQIIEIADETSNDTITTDDGEKANSEWIARSRLRVDARKWVMSKLAPKKYGDKIDVTSDGESVNLSVEDRAAKLAALAGLAAKRKQDQEDGSDLL